MKETFYEFYKLPSEKVDDIWANGLLIVDTNVLLDFYRLGPESRKDLKKSIDFFGNRVWLPYQAGLEFHRNRESVIKELGGSKYEEFEKLLNTVVVPKLKEWFKTFYRHPCIDYDYIEKSIEKFRENLEKKNSEWKKDYPFDVDNDDVLKWITTKFEGKIGEDNTTKELLEIYEEGVVRYKAEVPPGYKDASNKDKKESGERYVYGDLIVWKSVIQKAKKNKTDVIFLTNDNKEDWYEKHRGETKGPRFELIREFHKETGMDIIIMSEASFLKEMKNKSDVKVKDSSIEDAEKALKAVYSYEWYNPIRVTWPLIKNVGDDSFPNTILDVSDGLNNVEPVVFKKLSDLNKCTSFFDNTKLGYVDLGSLSNLSNGTFLGMLEDDNNKNDKNK